MKIWYDTTPTSQPVANDCTVISGQAGSFDLPITVDDIRRIRVRTLKRCESLHIQRCCDGRWLVCDPVRSGRLIVLDPEGFLVLEQFRTVRTPLEVMKASSDLLPSDIEEGAAIFYKLGFLQNVHQPSLASLKDETETLTAWLHVTNACNLRCHYCYVSKTTESMANHVAQRAIDAIFRTARKQRLQGVTLKYAGGEASLHIAQVLEIHDYAISQAQQHGLALDAHILSNGVVLSQSTIDQLRARNIGITISLDGVGAYHDKQRPFIGGHGSFKYVDQTIRRLLTNGVIPHITVTVSQRNLDGLPDLMMYILKRELPFTLSYYRDNEYSVHIHDLPFTDEQMIAAMRSVFALIERHLPSRSLLSSLIDKADLASPHRYTCGAGRNYLVIDQHGSVAKCQVDMKRSVSTIDADDPLQAIRDDHSGVQGLSVEDKEGCRECDWRYWCTGGCPLLTYRATGRYDVKSPNCNIYKALFPEVLRLEALRLLKYKSPIALGCAAAHRLM
jgi:uncharacterized protein